MVGALVFAGILFYGVLYSGVSSFSGDDVGILDALRGRISAKAPGRGSKAAPGVGQLPGSTGVAGRQL